MDDVWCDTNLFVQVGYEEDGGERQRRGGEGAHGRRGRGESERAERWEAHATDANAVRRGQARSKSKKLWGEDSSTC